jgi:AbrB family looped-hinge helix DNA binding protein
LNVREEINMVTTMTRRGQTVVPSEIRKRFNIQPNAKLEWLAQGEIIRVIPIPVNPIRDARGIARGTGLMKALMENRKLERNRG